MCTQVIKRDGIKREFSLDKIKTAITKANKDVQEMSEDDIDKVVAQVGEQCNQSEEEIPVEKIQDIIESTLMRGRFYKTAKNYILYRDERTRIRQGKTKLLKEVGDKIKAINIANQNANVDEASFGGRRGEASGELMKEMALNYCMSKKSRENHLNNEIYIHDLDYYVVGAHNCLSIPFDKLLESGFNVKQTDVRPANSINTAFQLVAVIFQLQSLQQFGGVSATHLDWTMVPYVRKSFYKHYKEVFDILPFVKCKIKEKNITDISIEDPAYIGKHWFNFIKKYVAKKALKLTKKELKQAVEGMYHNLKY